jgi:nicotinate phosphoribosyltransferase
VEHAIEVARELEARGGALAGIRLDSGDLAQLAKEARRALDAAGLGGVQILASGALDEHEIARLATAGAPIDAYGVGTKIGVAEDAPALDSVYKLVRYGGEPVAKLSTAKATLPGPKQVWRVPDMGGDVIGLADEAGPGGSDPLLVEVLREGRRAVKGSIQEAAAWFAADLEALPAGLRSLNPDPYPVGRTLALTRLAGEVADRIRARELN